MKIAIDLDDVLSNTYEVFIEFINERIETPIRFNDMINYHLHEILKISRGKEIEAIREFDNSKFFDMIEKKEGSSEAIKDLKKKYELAVITSRPLDIRNQTVNWINKHFPEIKNVYFINKDYYNETKSKAEICKEINAEIIIEDNLDYAKECLKENIRVLLFDCPWNRKNNLGKGIIRVHSWDEIRNLLIA